MEDLSSYIVAAKKLVRRFINTSYTSTIDEWVVIDDINVVWSTCSPTGWQVVMSVCQAEDMLYQASHNELDHKTKVGAYTVANGFVSME